MYQRHIQEQLQNYSLGRRGLPSMPLRLTHPLVNQGIPQTVTPKDEAEGGKLMSIKPIVHSTLKVNKNREKKDRVKQVFQLAKKKKKKKKYSALI
eukprot:Trichotokara_eunicae@DN11004_c0_g1_i1.p1